MSHLHIPDGLLPPWVWGAGLLVALLLLVRASVLARSHSPQRIAYQGALGGLMLAAMAIPLGPFEYHLTLAGPMGVLLGGAGAFQVAFVVSAILALMGHGGFTVVGLNALVLGSGAIVAHRVHGLVAHRLKPGPALAVATAVGQAVAGALWLVVVGFSLRLAPGVVPGASASDGRLGVFSAVALPLWAVGIMVESVIAFGLGRFLARVQPGLLPHARPAPAEAATPAREVA